MTAEERAAIVYDIVRDGFIAADGDLVVVASDAALTGPEVRLTLAVERDGQVIDVSNPFVFVNPPIAVADGSGAILDPEAAVVAMLLGAVA